MNQDSYKNRFMKCGKTSQIFIAYNEYIAFLVMYYI